MKVNIFGVSTDNKVIAGESFETYRNDWDDKTMFSKEVFEHHEEGLNFKYQYCIQAIAFDGKVCYSLSIVPTPESLDKGELKSAADCCGIEEDEVKISDVFDYGCSVIMGQTITPFEVQGIDEEVINDIASVVSTIDSLRGFYLDKAHNAIGTSGWDWLNDYVNGESAIEKTFARHKN